MPEPQTNIPAETHLRDHLANERTLLSWVRLGLSAAGFGFVVARFGLFLRARVRHPRQPRPRRGGSPSGSGSP